MRDKMVCEDDIDTEAAAEMVKWYDGLPRHEKLAIGRRVQRGIAMWVSNLRRLVIDRRHRDKVYENRNRFSRTKKPGDNNVERRDD